MDYEDFYQQTQILEKSIKDKLQGAQKTFKNVSKNSEKGDLKSLLKDLNQMQELLREKAALIDELKNLAEEFDARAYIEGGEFAKQMIEYCEQYSVDVKGEFPTYEIFPYKVKIDAENQDLYVDRKKVQCLRPASFVKDIQRGRERLMKAAFNANSFLNELAAAYDRAAIVKGSNNHSAKKDYDLLLRELYDYLTPMQRFRREYDMQSYAFDLARLYSSDVEYARDGRRFEFGTSRKSGKLIRILDQNGNEQLLGTIRFYSFED